MLGASDQTIILGVGRLLSHRPAHAISANHHSVAMTADDFRQLALGQFNARVASRLGTIEFLVGDKVFATLEAATIAAAPTVFSPQTGGAGARGVTRVRLALAEVSRLKPVLAQAVGKARNSRTAFTRLD